MSTVEIIAALFGLACVVLYVRESSWSWPTGLVQVTLYVWVFWQARLFSDVLLHLIYVVLQLYGWFRWTRGSGRGRELPIRRISRTGMLVWLVVAAIGTVTLGSVTDWLLNAALPYWDAAIAVISLIATYLLARKVLENWLAWIAVDVLGIGVYASRELYATAVLYGVFLGLASLGWLTWRRSYRQSLGQATDSCSASSSPLIADTSF